MADQEQDQQNQNEGGKVEKKFQTALKKLTAILSGEAAYKPAKLVGLEVITAVQELAKEEKEAKAKEFKEKAKALIQKKRDFDSFVKKQKQELEKKIQEEQKKFTEDAEKLFQLVEDIANIEKSYYETLGNAEEGKVND